MKRRNFNFLFLGSLFLTALATAQLVITMTSMTQKGFTALSMVQ